SPCPLPCRRRRRIPDSRRRAGRV
ncbi:uncharacterized protein METZ01_LOCUS325433, partial [marine metagenome]